MGSSAKTGLAKRTELLSVIAAVVAYPAAIAFVWLLLIGQHEGLLGFSLVWLLGAGVSVRLSAQFLRLWHGVGYQADASSVALKRPLAVRAAPPEMTVSIEVPELQGSDEWILASAHPRSPFGS
jgi:hypothetical protein